MSALNFDVHGVPAGMNMISLGGGGAAATGDGGGGGGSGEGGGGEGGGGDAIEAAAGEEDDDAASGTGELDAASTDAMAVERPDWETEIGTAASGSDEAMVVLVWLLLVAARLPASYAGISPLV
eukprot:5688636-Pleurochrysis_carterae.AAC.2